MTIAPNETFLEAADRIGTRLCRDAIWAGERCNWLGWSLEPLGSGWVHAYRAQKAGLYDGTAGIGLFLATLYQFTRDPIQKATAEGAFRQARAAGATIEPTARASLFNGIAGIAHALIHAAQALEEEHFEKDAINDLAALAETPLRPDNIDIVGGSAGAIQVLLSASAHFHRDDLTHEAVRHGDHLLGQAIRSSDGWAWDTLPQHKQKPLLGYAHGTSGIACALLELFHVTREERFREGALGAFQYERAHFSTEAGNWPDFRELHGAPSANDQPSFPVAWCHGAPGVGLSRLRASQIIPTDTDLAQEMQAALQTTINHLARPPIPSAVNFSLCHGVAGNAETLLVAAEVFDKPELKQQADQVGHTGLQQFHATNMPWPCGVMSAGETPNLMLGLAGTGYFYLRLYRPAKVNSVLLVTPPENGKAAAA